jgi:hypothetical protein
MFCSTLRKKGRHVGRLVSAQHKVNTEKSAEFFAIRYKLSLRAILKMGPIVCPDTSVRNCQYSLRNNAEKLSSQIFTLFYNFCTTCINLIQGLATYIYWKMEFRENWRCGNYVFIVWTKYISIRISTFILRFGWHSCTWNPRTFNSVQHFWASWKSAEGRPCFPYCRKLSYNKVRRSNLRYFASKELFLKSVYHVTEHNTCHLSDKLIQSRHKKYNMLRCFGPRFEAIFRPFVVD